MPYPYDERTGRVVARAGVAVAVAVLAAAVPAVVPGGARVGASVRVADLVWDELADCESGGDWRADTGNGYYGGLQIHPTTWAETGGLHFADRPDHASRREQTTVGEEILRRQGWEAWPSCARELGMIGQDAEDRLPGPSAGAVREGAVEERAVREGSVREDGGVIQGELFDDLPGDRSGRARVRTEPAPGAVLLPDWLDRAAQRRLVAACREWALPPAGLHSVRMPTGGVMSVRMVSLGWHWYPYGYARVAEDGAPVKPFPPLLGELARRAVADAYGEHAGGIAGAVGYEPDTAIVNHYPHGAKMGLHQDRDERVDAPVVSISLGDDCVFRLGNTETRTRPWTDLELRSGDLLVFGGPSRFAYHGVVRTLPGTADRAFEPELVGRLNITVRQSGLGA